MKNNRKIITEVSKEFISSLKILKRKTKNPVVIALVGLIGAGKSSVAKYLAPLIGASVIEGDAIRIALRKKEQNYNPVQNIREKAIMAAIKVESNVILDSDSINPEKREQLNKKAKQAGAKLVYLRIFADRNAMIERLIRAKYNPNKNLFKDVAVAVREMWRRTPHHYNWSAAEGGRFILKKLKIPFIAQIDTTTPEWYKKIHKVAAKIRKF